MSRIEPAETIEATVGIKRSRSWHFARAVSAEQRVYVLHSEACMKANPDPRACTYSVALDLGIDLGVWSEHEDRAVWVQIDSDHGDLVPLDLTDEMRTELVAESGGIGEGSDA